MRLITHSGGFHADDVLAYSILSAIFPRAELLRTRDPGILRSADGDDVVFDVGMEYDPARRRYDHHQIDSPLRDDGTPYSAVGLVWKHHGMDYLRVLSGRDHGESLNERVWERIDKRIMLEIDRCDNGVSGFGDISERTDATFHQIVEDFAPSWDDADQDYDRRFLAAASFMGRTLENRARKLVSAYRAEHRVLTAFRTAEDPAIAIIPDGMPAASLASEQGPPDLLYLVEKSRHNGDWHVNCVRPAGDPFGMRKPLPAEWAGLRGKELARVAGVPDAVFCHKERFTCAARSFESALRMARSAVRCDHAPLPEPFDRRAP